MSLLKGIICLWYGVAEDLPEGWAICDGTNGTPDLCRKYVVCAGHRYGVGETGGGFFHYHTMEGWTTPPTAYPPRAAHYAGQASPNNHTHWFAKPALVVQNKPPYMSLYYIQKL